MNPMSWSTGGHFALVQMMEGEKRWLFNDMIQNRILDIATELRATNDVNSMIKCNNQMKHFSGTPNIPYHHFSTSNSLKVLVF